MSDTKFTSFKEFYPYYLSEHKLPITKLLHIIGSLCSLGFLISMIISKKYQYIPFVFIIGYGFAWISHFAFEKNKPATFKYPLYSFIGDWIMLKDVITRKIKL
tara:strand:- start:206 stop:514 length:309 start_codon:yes stop_codon:yes gene_type:complete